MAKETCPACGQIADREVVQGTYWTLTLCCSCTACIEAVATAAGRAFYGVEMIAKLEKEQFRFLKRDANPE